MPGCAVECSDALGHLPRSGKARHRRYGANPRAGESGQYWRTRIAAYLACELHPQHALKPRVSYLACNDDSIVGFVAGHLTRRHGRDGELEWINVIPDWRGSGIASELLRLLAAWFVAQRALRICVDVQPTNRPARTFYKRHGAEDLGVHWLVWPNIEAVLRKRPQLGPVSKC